MTGGISISVVRLQPLLPPQQQLSLTIAGRVSCGLRTSTPTAVQARVLVAPPRRPQPQPQPRQQLPLWTMLQLRTILISVTWQATDLIFTMQADKNLLLSLQEHLPRMLICLSLVWWRNMAIARTICGFALCLSRASGSMVITAS